MKTFQVKVIISPYQEILISEEIRNLITELSRDKNLTFTPQAILPTEVIILNHKSDSGITPLLFYSPITFTVKLIMDRERQRLYTMGRIDQLNQDVEAFISLHSDFHLFSIIPLVNCDYMDITPFLPIRQAEEDERNFTTLRTIISTQLPENLWFSDTDKIWHPVSQLNGRLSFLISQTGLAYRSKTPMLMSIPSPATHSYAPSFTETTPRRSAYNERNPEDKDQG